MRYLIFISMIVCTGFTPSAYAANTSTKASIEQRIKPIGDVTLEGEVKPAPQVVEKPKVQAVVVSKPDGSKTYKQFCSVCHNTGLAGAPKKGDQTAWDERTKKGMKKLIAIATQGIKAMPPKGTCATCSEQDLKAAIVYMLPKSLQKKIK